MADAAMPTTFEGVKTSPNLTLSLQRALDQARELRHRHVGIEHLLLALTDDPDATGSLEACGVDLDRLKGDIATYVSKAVSAPDGEAAIEPVPSPELRNMLDQAVDAAREAKRQEINSFIVLAAIVGQEKSQAASILQAHGFTFNEAIQALKPRAARTEEDGGPAAARPPKRAPVREAEQPLSASQVEEALAQSENALPPLPSAPSRLPRPAPAQPVRPEPDTATVRHPSNMPPPTATPPLAPHGRPALQSDDIMASIRDKAGPPRGTAGGRGLEPRPDPRSEPQRPEPRADGGLEQAAGAPPPLAMPPTMPRAPVRPAPQPRAPAAVSPPPMPPPPVRGPAASRSDGGRPDGGRPEGIGAAGAPDRRSVEPFDLGAPLPEERTGSAGRGPRGDQPEAPPARRREPTLGMPPPSQPPSPPAGAPPHQGGYPTPPQMAPQPGPHGQHQGSAAPVARPTSPPSPQGHPPRGTGMGAPGMRGPSPAGAMPPLAPAPLGAPPLSAPRAGGRRNNLEAVNPGQLAEAIPRRMRAHVPERVEVRIAKRSFDGLAIGIEGRGAPVSHDIVITSAMSVRLKAPDGGFAIDGVTPETQWIENRPGLISNDDFASWRWTVTPLTSGRKRLHLIVSARTAGPDGSTAETALPDQVIEIKVRTNYGLAVRRWGGWIAAAVIGGALGKFGEGSLELLRKLAGL